MIKNIPCIEIYKYLMRDIQNEYEVIELRLVHPKY